MLVQAVRECIDALYSSIKGVEHVPAKESVSRATPEFAPVRQYVATEDHSTGSGWDNFRNADVPGLYKHQQEAVEFFDTKNEIALVKSAGICVNKR